MSITPVTNQLTLSTQTVERKVSIKKFDLALMAGTTISAVGALHAAKNHENKKAIAFGVAGGCSLIASILRKVLPQASKPQKEASGSTTPVSVSTTVACNNSSKPTTPTDPSPRSES